MISEVMITLNMKVMVTETETYKVESFLRNIIINLQNSDTWKIQLTIAYLIMTQMTLLMNSLCHFVEDIKEI